MVRIYKQINEHIVLCIFKIKKQIKNCNESLLITFFKVKIFLKGKKLLCYSQAWI